MWIILTIRARDLQPGEPSQQHRRQAGLETVAAVLLTDRRTIRLHRHTGSVDSQTVTVLTCCTVHQKAGLQLEDSRDVEL